MLKNWSNAVTVSGIVLAAVVLALNQALSGASNLRPYLPAFAISPDINYLPLLLLIIAGFAWLAGRHRIGSTGSTEQPQRQPQANTNSTTQFANVDEFYRTYDNALLVETEANIRQQSDRYAPGPDREKFLLRLFSSMLMLSVFELIFAQIYRSQLNALHELANRSLGVEELRTVFERAATANESLAKQIRFDQWMHFLTFWKLIIDANQRVELAPCGREFLKYLVHAPGHDENTRMF